MLANIAATISGLITVAALIAAETPSRETYGETVAAVAIALVLFWLARSYAVLVSWRLREGERLSASGLARSMLHELPTITGGVVPLLAIFVAWAAGARLDSAINAALWTAAATIVVIEIVVGIQAGLSGRELLIQTAAGVTLGLLVLALRLVLH